MRDPLESGCSMTTSGRSAPRLRLALTATVTRNRSLDARLLLARAALGDAGTLDDLLAAARAGDRALAADGSARGDPPLLAAVAQTLAQQELLPDRPGRRAGPLRADPPGARRPRAEPGQPGLHVQLALADEGPARARELLAGYRRISDRRCAACGPT
jgi:hypothetical protein